MIKIILIGFMGAGKSTVAKKISKKITVKHIEMDEEVIKLSNLSNINDIFKTHGEDFFRKLEKQVSQALGDQQNVVISTGGGAGANEEIINNLRGNSINSIVIYLQTSFDEIKHRLEHDTTRPLFQDLEKAYILYNTREKLYIKNSDIIVNTNKKKIDQVIEEIFKKLKL